VLSLCEIVLELVTFVRVGNVLLVGFVLSKDELIFILSLLKFFISCVKSGLALPGFVSCLGFQGWCNQAGIKAVSLVH
jgi:hypothetical protein